MKRHLLVLPLLVLAACGKKAAEEDAPKPTAEVKTAVVSASTFPDTVTAYGAAEFAPGAEHGLSAPAEANISQVLVGAGTRVSAGQPVMVLAPSPQSKLDLQKGVQDARTAAEAYARAQRLRSTGLVSDADVETAHAASATAQAALGSLRSRLGQLTVRAPVAGVVETITGSPGDLVAAGANLGKVGALTPPRVRLGVDPTLARQLRPGLLVHVGRVQGGGEVDGRIASVDPRADAQTRLATVIVTPAASPRLDPGETVKGAIVLREVTGEVVPRAAVYYDQDQAYLLVVAGGVAKKRDVKLGAELGGGADATVQVAEGLKPGERIVVEGGASLDDGTAVKEAPAPAAAKEDKGA